MYKTKMGNRIESGVAYVMSDTIEEFPIPYKENEINELQKKTYYEIHIDRDILNYIIQIFVAYTLYIDRGIVLCEKIREKFKFHMNGLKKLILRNKYLTKMVFKLTISFHSKKTSYILPLIEVEHLNKIYNNIYDIYLEYHNIIHMYQLPLLNTKITYFFYENSAMDI
jgi:hypothetical protein